MRKLIVIIGIMLICVSSAYSAITVIESKKISTDITEPVQTVTIVCIDGYQYVIVSVGGRYPAITQSYRRAQNSRDSYPISCIASGGN